MVIVMRKNATEAQIDHVIQWIESIGYRAHSSPGVEQTIIDTGGKKIAQITSEVARWIEAQVSRKDLNEVRMTLPQDDAMMSGEAP